MAELQWDRAMGHHQDRVVGGLFDINYNNEANRQPSATSFAPETLNKAFKEKKQVDIQLESARREEEEKRKEQEESKRIIPDRLARGESYADDSLVG
ncbi:MAG: hypothetical protein M1830_002478 [Pleopsidium flavum]|nr:MAG: hypothetical protein M1830_002478 [Pleopsidium flavum]